MIPPYPRCGKDNFKKTRDLTAHLERKFKCKPSSTPISIARPQSPPPAPVVHARGKDRRREKPESIQAPIPQDQGVRMIPRQVPAQNLARLSDKTLILIGLQESLESI